MKKQDEKTEDETTSVKKKIRNHRVKEVFVFVFFLLLLLLLIELI